MYKRITLIFFAIAAAGIAIAGTELISFDAYAVIDHARLEWATGPEDNLRSFVVERSQDGQVFMAIGQVVPTGSFSHYQFVDSSPLDADMERTFYYRLRMVDQDGTARFSPVEEVSLSFSAVQHTWGSIKAMFR
ncbi:hypothetical protein KKH27_08180 [bacterium]|nr:hypothetical protein [bacterium]MBU1985453.1 hypothetical protein [bacterium]